MIKTILLVLVTVVIVFSEKPVSAQSQDACAIWLCLPGGFPSGCGGAYSEFKKRLKKGREPLPKLSSCTNEGTSGRYQMGVEYFEQCKEGYQLEVKGARHQYGGRFSSFESAECKTPGCSPNSYRQCDSYDAVHRPKPHYIDIWVNGAGLGRYFYQ
jgi:hypothetical protein